MSREATNELLVRVARHFAAPEWFTTFEVPVYGAVDTEDGKDRLVDALEVKSDRGDWLRELAHPLKSEAWVSLADRYILVAGKGVARKDEIPPSWGFLEASGSGLRAILRGALLSTWREKRGCDPIPREMWVRILRRTLERGDGDPHVAAAYSKGLAEGVKRGKLESAGETWRMSAELDRLKVGVARFQEASGLDLSDWSAGDVGKGECLEECEASH